jgi:hypothetical protein
MRFAAHTAMGRLRRAKWDNTVGLDDEETTTAPGDPTRPAGHHAVAETRGTGRVTGRRTTAV